MSALAKTNIYLFYGPDTRRSLSKLQEWKGAFVKKHGAGAVRYTTPEEAPIRLTSVLGDVSLFSPVTLTIITDPFGNGNSDGVLDTDDFLKVIENGGPSENHVILWQRGSLDKRLTLTKQILENAKSGRLQSFEFEFLSGDDALTYIAAQFAPYGLKVRKDAGELLCAYASTGGGELDSWASHSAVKQLAAYCHGKDMVTIEDVRAVVPPAGEEDVFLPLLKSFAAKDQRAFAEHFNSLVRNASAEQELLGVLGALYEQAKNLVLVSQLREAGNSADIDKELGFKKGRSRFLLADASRFKSDDLRAFLDHIISLERDVKQGRVPLAPAVLTVVQSL